MRERLTGAIILVAMIVLLVPELLTGPVRSAPRTAAVEAAAEGAPLRSYTINLSDDRSRSAAPQASGPEQPAPLPAATSSAPSEAAAQPPAAPASAAEAPRTAPSSAGAAAPPAPAPTTHPPSASPTHNTAVRSTATKSSPSGAGAFMVQLGSFGSRANADRLAQEIRARGFPVNVSQGSSGRKLYRVRVGPAHDHAAAEELAAKLRAAGHPGGEVVPR